MTTNDAKWSKHPCYKQDPLPNIDPALLNSVDIRRYVDNGCLIEKDSFDPTRMKPASYEMRFLGELYHWEKVDGRLEKESRTVSAGKYIRLYKNSISYLWMAERLLLPEYIAARFNLRIRDVHKGILLGTGPLIDPGFGGQLLIPLHNLTDNDYELCGGDGIIWVEFTKVSKNDHWLSNRPDTERPSDLVAFPKGKEIDHPNRYLGKAGAVGGVQSAFKGELARTTRVAGDAKSIAKAARKRVDELDARTTTWGIGGAILGALGLVALLVSAYQISFPVMERVHRQSDRIGELEERLQDMVETQSNGPVIAPTEEAGTTTQEPASDAAQPVEAPD